MSRKTAKLLRILFILIGLTWWMLAAFSHGPQRMFTAIIVGGLFIVASFGLRSTRLP